MTVSMACGRATVELSVMLQLGAHVIEWFQ